jgi:hypothetical protein
MNILEWMYLILGLYIDILQPNPLYVDTKHTLHHSINFERERDMEATEPVGVIWYSLISMHFSRVCRLPSKHSCTYL